MNFQYFFYIINQLGSVTTCYGLSFKELLAVGANMGPAGQTRPEQDGDCMSGDCLAVLINTLWFQSILGSCGASLKCCPS